MATKSAASRKKSAKSASPAKKRSSTRQATTSQTTEASPPGLRIRNQGIRRVRVGDIIENPMNFRQHPKSQKDAFRATVEELGWYSYPDVFVHPEHPEKFMLIDGELRKHELVDHYGEDAYIDVNLTDFDLQEARKALATKDPLAAMAATDKDILTNLLKELQPENEAFSSLIQELADREKITIASLTEGNTDPDDVPEPPDEAITQPGDLWILGDHRLLCGDSGNPEHVDRLLDGASIHLVSTDPPYNVKVEPRSNNAIAAGNSSFSNKHHQKFDLERHPEKSKPTQKKMRAKDRPLANDFVSDEAFDEMLHAWFGNIARVLLPGHGFYCWGGYANVANYPPVFKACGLYFSQAVIWHKMHPVLTRKDFMGDHEWCFYGWREGAAHRWFGPNNIPDVWSVKKVNPQSMVHLTEKPVELTVRALQYSSLAGENVLDLFGGSGSTLIGAEQTGRRAFLMELDPLYCDVIVERWEQFKGCKAERQSAVEVAT